MDYNFKRNSGRKNFIIIETNDLNLVHVFNGIYILKKVVTRSLTLLVLLRYVIV